MQASEADSIPPTGPTIVPSVTNGDLPVVPGGSGRRWRLTLAAGLVAGLIAWLGGELCLDLIKPPRHPIDSKGIILHVTYHREEAAAEAQNAGLAFVFLGAAFGSAMGIAGGLVRRSGRSAVAAGLLGLTLGPGAAAGASLVLLPRYNAYKAEHPDEAVQDMLYPLLIHAIIWSAIGVAAGIAYGLGQGAGRGLPAVVAAGFSGAALAAIAYELIGALGFPEAQTARFVSTTWQTRLFARLAVTLAAAVGLALAAAGPPKPAVPPAS